MHFPKAHLEQHHRYQLEGIFGFILSLCLFAFFYTIIEQVLLLDIHAYQWTFFVAWVLLYGGILLKKRAQVPNIEFKQTNKRPLLQWIVIGICLVIWLITPWEFSAEKPAILRYMYVIFSIFMADSYLDFRETQ